MALPALLPLLGLMAAALTGWAATAGWIACLAGKAIGNRWLLWRFTGHRSGPVDLVFEIASDLLLPVLYLSALVRPQRLSWRTRRISLIGGKIEYK